MALLRESKKEIIKPTQTALSDGGLPIPLCRFVQHRWKFEDALSTNVFQWCHRFANCAKSLISPQKKKRKYTRLQIVIIVHIENNADLMRRKVGVFV